MSPKRAANLDSDDPFSELESRPTKRSKAGIHTKVHYRKLFQNESQEVLSSAQVLPGDITIDQHGLITWTPDEKARFFQLLSRHGRHAVDVIAKGLGTKSVPEVADYLRRLRDGYVERHVKAERMALWRLDELPAAVEVSKEFEGVLDKLAIDLEKAEGRKADEGEIAMHGALAVIDGDNVDELYQADDDQDGAGIDDADGGNGDDMNDASTSSRKRRQSVPNINLNHSNLEAAAAVLDTPRLLELSQYVFMNSTDPAANYRTMHLPPQPSQSEPTPAPTISRPSSSHSTSDNQPSFPGLHATALIDLYSHALSCTRRLVSTANFLALERIRAIDTNAKRTPLQEVREQDVLAALDILDLKHDAREYWVGVPRKLALKVYRGKSDRPATQLVQLEYDEVEDVLRGEGRWPRASASAAGGDDDGGMGAATAEEDLAFDVADDMSVASDVTVLSRAQSHADGSEPGSNNDDDENETEIGSDADPDNLRSSPEISTTDLEDISADTYAELVDSRAAALDEYYIRAALQGKPLEDIKDTDSKQDMPKPERTAGRRKTIEEVKDWRDWMRYKSQWERYPRPVVHGTMPAESIEAPEAEALRTRDSSVRRKSVSASPGRHSRMRMGTDLDDTYRGDGVRGRDSRSRSRA